MSLRLLGKRCLANGVFLRLDRQHLLDENGAGVRRDVIRHPGGVAVLPVEDDQVWLISQRRAPFGVDVLEVPAGRLEPADRDPAAAARRELAEELGAVATGLIPLARMMPSPGYTDEVIHVFAAVGLTLGGRSPDGVEERNAVLVCRRLDEALLSIDDGVITDAKTQVAILLWDRKRSAG